MASAAPFQLICHGPGAPALRLGLGPGWRPVQALLQLQRLFDQHSFWAQDRRPADLGEMLRASAAVVSIWQGEQLVAFGRACSDGLYRAVLWDVVVATDHQGRGLGRQLVSALLTHSRLRRVERVYLMTSNSSGFYEQLGFNVVEEQQLMLLKPKASSG